MPIGDSISQFAIPPDADSTTLRLRYDHNQYTLVDGPNAGTVVDYYVPEVGATVSVGSNIDVIVENALITKMYDEIDLSYTGANLTTVVYKLAGITQNTLTLTYTGSNLTKVVRT